VFQFWLIAKYLVFLGVAALERRSVLGKLKPPDGDAREGEMGEESKSERWARKANRRDGKEQHKSLSLDQPQRTSVRYDGGDAWVKD